MTKQERQPLVSILIPVYNVEYYLEKCLDTVENQTYQNLEIILVDDGSTDHSLDIIKGYAGILESNFFQGKTGDYFRLDYRNYNYVVEHILRLWIAMTGWKSII